MGSGAAKQKTTVTKVMVRSKEHQRSEEEEEATTSAASPGLLALEDGGEDEVIEVKSAPSQPRPKGIPVPAMCLNPKAAPRKEAAAAAARAADVAAEKENVAKVSNFSPRSFSSDEDILPTGDSIQNGSALAHLGVAPKKVEAYVPKEKFGDVLKAGYEERAKQRNDWLRSLSENKVPDSMFVKLDVPGVIEPAKESAGFSDTRRPLSVLREPDIMDEVRKFNVKMHRTDMPMAAGA